MAKWYIKRNDKQAGPFVSAQLKQLAAEGKIRPDDLLRREGQDSWHKAELIKGLLVAPKQEEPKPEEVQSPATQVPTAHISKAITNTESSASFQRTLQSGASSLWNATKRTGEIAAKQTEIAKITQFSLPAAYQSLGEAYYNSRSHDQNSNPIISEISEIKAEIIRESERIRNLPSSTVAEKAKFVAAQATSVAKEKVNHQKIRKCFQTLGETLRVNGNNEPEFVSHQERIQSLLKTKVELAKRIEELRATSTAPQTISPVPSPDNLHANRTKILWSLPIVVCLCALMLTTLSFLAKASLTRLVGDKTEANAKQEKIGGLPDFKKIDYSFDFSKTDYESIPANAKREVRERKEGDSFIVSKGYTTKILDLSEVSSIEDAPLYLTLHGKQEIYSDSTKKRLISDSMYFHEKPHGMSHFYDENGEIKGVVPWVDGKKHGIELWTYSNKNPKIQNHYLNGKGHGPHEEWFENGQKKREATFVDGIKEGKHWLWFSDGSVQASAFYIEGKRSGDFERYGLFGRNQQRRLIAKGKCEQGEMIGTWTVILNYPKGAEYLNVVPGPWSGGTREQFLAKLQLLGAWSDDIEVFDGVNGFHLLNRSGQLPAVIGAVFLDKSQYMKEIGLPDLDMQDPDYRPTRAEDIPKFGANRLFRYDCTDGPLVFKAILFPERATVYAGGVRIMLDFENMDP